MNNRHNIDNIITPKALIYLGVLIGVMFIAYITVHYGILYGIIYSALPLGTVILLKFFDSPKIAYFTVFIINYFLMGLYRYIPSAQGGIILDALLFFILFTLMIKSINSKVEWRNGVNILSILALIWFIYCFFEIFNPNASYLAWVKSVRGITIYFLIISIITPIVLTKFIDLKRFMIILSILTIVAVLKVFVQKYIGFDIFEKRWLYLDGGGSTHVIQSGIRYFSFFTDAGNFGAAMGFATVLFALISQHFSKKLRYYFIAVSIFAAIGLIFSGARGALFVPFAGFGLGIILTKDFRKITLGVLTLLLFVSFLMFSTRGDGNSYIRRMRTAFNQEDASFMVRKNNQKLLWELMKDKPFGNGIGMGGTKAQVFAPESPISSIPTDSWYVLIWVETGLVGVLLYLMIQIYILCHGLYLVLYRLRSPIIKGCISAIVAALFGMLVAAYGNEIWGQLPNIFILTACQAFIFMGPKLDNELVQAKHE